MGKKLIGMAVVAIMLFGVFALTGCDLEGEKTYIGSTTDKVKILAAFEKITEIDFYTETMHTLITTDGVQEFGQKNVIKYQQKDGSLIAEGYSIINNEIESYIYIKNNYKYVRLAFSETGVKFPLEYQAVSNSALEPGNILSDKLKQIAFDLKVTKTKENTTIYSFKYIEDDIKISDYKITTHTSTGRIIEFKTDWYNTTALSTTTTCTITYDYTPIEVMLPDNLDLYEVIV